MPQPDPRQSDRLYELLLELRQDTLSDADRDQLNQLLRDNAQLRTVAADFLMDEASLIHELRTNECRNLFQDSGMTAGVDDLSVPMADQTAVSCASPAQAAVQTSARSRLPWYAVICAAAAFGFVWGMVSRDRKQAGETPGMEVATQVPSVSQPAVCGTLTLDVDCDWASPMSLGDHLLAGQYELQQGIAGLHLTDGSRLFVEGPAEFEIRTSRYVVLKSGRVVAEVSEEAVGFRLETPTTSVVDVGTAFEVSVDAAGESELEVIEGAVTLLPTDSEVDVNPPLIFSGDVRRIAGTDSSVTGKAPQAGFRRRLDSLRQLQPETELIAFDGFDTQDTQDGYINGGHGWQTPWQLGWQAERPASVVLRRGRNIDAPIWLPERSEGYVVCPTGSVSRRMLATPLDLAADQNYYISFLLRTRPVGNVNQRQTGSGLRISSSADRDTGFGVCIDWNQHLTTWSGEQRWRGELLMEDDRSFLIVLRITASADQPDAVHAISFSAKSLPCVVEPSDWQSWCQPHAVDVPLDMITLWSGQSAVSLVDEIRIGTTWRSVVPVR